MIALIAFGCPLKVEVKNLSELKKDIEETNDRLGYDLLNLLEVRDK